MAGYAPAALYCIESRGKFMNDIQIFNSPEFGEIRTVLIDGQPWFVGRDIAKALGYARPDNAVATHCKHSLKQGVPSLQSSDKEVEATIIPEGDMYRLISKSKLKSAEQFEEWVFDEVLPTIRKTGQYGQAQLQLPQTTMELLELHYKALKEVGGKVEIIADDLNEMKGDYGKRIEHLENNMTLDYGQQRVLEDAVNKTVTEALGGKTSCAYEEIGRKVFAECNRDLKHYFSVNARANVPRKRFDEAVEYARNWKPCTNTVIRIQNYNAQQTLDV